MRIETNTEAIAEIPWGFEEPFAPMAFGTCAGQLTSNIRSVGFIARPDAVKALKICIEERVMKLLRRVPGFSAAIILHSHKELRRVDILTFWKTEMQATQTGWEQFSVVCDLVYPLVDACTKAQTFHGAFINGQPGEAISIRNS